MRDLAKVIILENLATALILVVSWVKKKRRQQLKVWNGQRKGWSKDKFALHQKRCCFVRHLFWYKTFFWLLVKFLPFVLYFIENMIYFNKFIDICINRQESPKVVNNYFVGTKVIKQSIINILFFIIFYNKYENFHFSVIILLFIIPNKIEILFHT